MRFKQLTSGQRYQISAYIALGFNQSQIAKLLNVNRSTISKELKRHSANGMYCPELAEQQARQRRKQATKRSVNSEVIRWIHFF